MVQVLIPDDWLRLRVRKSCDNYEGSALTCEGVVQKQLLCGETYVYVWMYSAVTTYGHQCAKHGCCFYCGIQLRNLQQHCAYVTCLCTYFTFKKPAIFPQISRSG